MKNQLEENIWEKKTRYSFEDKKFVYRLVQLSLQKESCVRRNIRLPDLERLITVADYSWLAELIATFVCLNVLENPGT